MINASNNNWATWIITEYRRLYFYMNIKLEIIFDSWAFLSLTDTTKNVWWIHFRHFDFRVFLPVPISYRRSGKALSTKKRRFSQEVQDGCETSYKESKCISSPRRTPVAENKVWSSCFRYRSLDNGDTVSSRTSVLPHNIYSTSDVRRSETRRDASYPYKYDIPFLAM
ncbi:hypothetical protein QQ045_004358 [Rhodiola kirilowii]